MPGGMKRGVPVRGSAGTIFLYRRAAEDAREAIHDSETLQELARIFKMLGDETCLKIPLVLARQELCVSDVASVVGFRSQRCRTSCA
jgi:hypothetical protein